MARAPEKASAGLFGDDTPKADAAERAEWVDLPEPPKVGEQVLYPYDGQAVTLLSSGRDKEAAAVWRSTRAIKDGRWDSVHFWALRNSGGQRVPFEPVAYKKFEEPVFMPKNAEAK